MRPPLNLLPPNWMLMGRMLLGKRRNPLRHPRLSPNRPPLNRFLSRNLTLNRSQCRKQWRNLLPHLNRNRRGRG